MMTDEQLAQLIDALDRIAAALENFSLASCSSEAGATMSAGSVTPKPPIKIVTPKRRVTRETTLSRRK